MNSLRRHTGIRAALAEIRQTVFNQLESEHEHDRDTVEDSIAVLRYLAENYENMGRTACARLCGKRCLSLMRTCGTVQKQGRNRIGLLLRIKGAQSLRKGRMRRPAGTCGGASPLDKQIQIEKNVFENYPMLVRDSVELSEEYLAVIDEVERLLEEECGENAHPLETAQVKARLLSERGILWRSEAVESGSSVRLKSREPIRK